MCNASLRNGHGETDSFFLNHYSIMNAKSHSQKRELADTLLDITSAVSDSSPHNPVSHSDEEKTSAVQSVWQIRY